MVRKVDRLRPHALASHTMTVRPNRVALCLRGATQKPTTSRQHVDTGRRANRPNPNGNKRQCHSFLKPFLFIYFAACNVADNAWIKDFAKILKAKNIEVVVPKQKCQLGLPRVPAL